MVLRFNLKDIKCFFFRTFYYTSQGGGEWGIKRINTKEVLKQRQISLTQHLHTINI